MNADARPTVLEFFAGAGLARLGLGGWRTAFANDFDPAKTRAYAANFGSTGLRQDDVWGLSVEDLPPGRADLAWASSPCQDLSLAGTRGGLAARRSGAFWGFWRLIEALDDQGRAPRLIVIENVTGLLTSNGGEDFRTLAETLTRQGWRFGALEIDAIRWLPQSRPRLFIVATREPVAGLSGPCAPFHSRGVVEAYDRLSGDTRAAWCWWDLSEPLPVKVDLNSLLEPDADVAWFDDDRTAQLLRHLGPLHRQRLDAALASTDRTVGTGFKRVRTESGHKVQRLEIRFDGTAGCLRTPAGGSSRQYVLVTESGRARARFLTPREAMRLMGVEDDYRLPASVSAGLKLAGDGVAVPVVRALSEGLLKPLLAGRAVHAA